MSNIVTSKPGEGQALALRFVDAVWVERKSSFSRSAGACPPQVHLSGANFAKLGYSVSANLLERFSFLPVGEPSRSRCASFFRSGARDRPSPYGGRGRDLDKARDRPSPYGGTDRVKFLFWIEHVIKTQPQTSGIAIEQHREKRGEKPPSA